jgi:hypothetical protein
MADEKKKWIKLGAVKTSKTTDASGKPTSSYIQLGTPKSKFEPVNVRLIVTDLTGTVLADVTNPNLNAQDPRKRPGITEDQAKKIPAYVKAELSLPPAKT